MSPTEASAEEVLEAEIVETHAEGAECPRCGWTQAKADKYAELQQQHRDSTADSFQKVPAALRTQLHRMGQQKREWDLCTVNHAELAKAAPAVNVANVAEVVGTVRRIPTHMLPEETKPFDNETEAQARELLRQHVEANPEVPAVVILNQRDELELVTGQLAVEWQDIQDAKAVLCGYEVEGLDDTEDPSGPYAWGPGH